MISGTTRGSGKVLKLLLNTFEKADSSFILTTILLACQDSDDAAGLTGYKKFMVCVEKAERAKGLVDFEISSNIKKIKKLHNEETGLCERGVCKCTSFQEQMHGLE